MTNAPRFEPTRETVRVTDVVSNTNLPIRRISWGAIVAGVAIAIIVHLALNLLGLGVGAAVIDPFQDQDTVMDFGTATIIWIVLSTLAAMFVGGWVAGRLAGLSDRLDSALHGLATWSVVTFITIFLIVSGVSRVVSGAANVIGSSFSLAGNTIENITPEVADAIAVQENTLEDIENEVRSLQDADGNTITNSELYVALRRLLREGTNASDETRQAVIDTLVAQTGVTREEATTTVQRWENTYQQTVEDVEVFATEAGEDVADGVATAAIIAFISMLAGAAAAGFGGLAGASDPRLSKTTAVSQTRSVAGASD